MKKALLIGLSAAMLSTAAPVTQMAQAHPTRHYRGGCTFGTVNDTLPTEPLGGQDQWTGEASAVVIATNTDTDPNPDINNSTPTPTDAISFECTLWRNGTTNLGVILSGSGTGVAADTDATFTFTAGPTDTVAVCEEVTVAGEVHGDSSTFNPAWCTDSERSTVIPEPVILLLEMVIELLDELVLGPVNDLLNQLVFGPTDAVTCWALRVVADFYGNTQPELLTIDPGSGDTTVLEVPFFDCPIYATNNGLRTALVITDFDSDGDEDSIVVVPLDTAGTIAPLTPEVVPYPRSPDTLFGANVGLLNLTASMTVADVDNDGEKEAVVHGAGTSGATNLDTDGDPDVTWVG